jgi:hypothetical protein
MAESVVDLGSDGNSISSLSDLSSVASRENSFVYTNLKKKKTLRLCELYIRKVLQLKKLFKSMNTIIILRKE